MRNHNSKIDNVAKGFERNAYFNEKDSSHSTNDNDKMIHISALPEDMNDDNGFKSPFSGALNKYANSKANNFAALSQEPNYYQSATDAKPHNRFTGVKKSKSRVLRLQQPQRSSVAACCQLFAAAAAHRRRRLTCV